MSDKQDAKSTIQLYEHYMQINARDLLAEYASSQVRGNRIPKREVAIEEAFKSREDEMDDYMIVVEERD